MRRIDTRVANLGELALAHGKHGTRFESRSVRVGAALGAKDLGYSYVVVPPGKRAVPFHSHRGAEEMFLILSGHGLLRLGSETRAIRQGDVICCPTGGPETGHQIVNDSLADLAYLCVSTIVPVEVVEYSEAKRIGTYCGDWAKDLAHVTAAGSDLDIWVEDDEP